jgi:hypothetical protein
LGVGMFPTKIDLLKGAIPTILLSLCCLALFSETASAAVPIRERLVEAVSSTRLCPSLSINRRVFDRVARKVGMDPTPGSKDMRLLEQQVARQVPRLLKFERGIICDIGKYNFGSDGEIIKGILKVR